MIIPTRNRPELLGRAVQLLLNQTLARSRYELIIVDSASTAATPALLARLAAEHSHIKTLRAEKPGVSLARNLGLNAAQAPLLLLLDDDILVEKTFLADVLAGAAAHPGRVLLGKINAPWDESTDPFQRFLIQARDVNIYDFPDPSNVPPNYFYTACVAIPREALGAARFDENFPCYGLEDIEFGIRLLQGRPGMVYLPALSVRHEYFPRYRDYRIKKRKLGCSLAYFLQKNPENARYFYVEPTAQRRFYRLYCLLQPPGPGRAGHLNTGSLR